MTLSPSSSSTQSKISPLQMNSSLFLGSIPAKKTEVPSRYACHLSIFLLTSPICKFSFFFPQRTPNLLGWGHTSDESGSRPFLQSPSTCFQFMIAAADANGSECLYCISVEVSSGGLSRRLLTSTSVECFECGWGGVPTPPHLMG